LIADDRLASDGAVGVALGGGAAPTVVVASGCRPIDARRTVTANDARTVLRLGADRAIDRLVRAVDALPPDDHPLAREGLRCRIVVREGDGDDASFITEIVGLDRARGGVQLRDAAPIGTTVQFELRDPAVVAEELAAALVPLAPARGALSFSAPGGSEAAELFGQLGMAATAGMACTGLVVPVDGTSARQREGVAVAVFPSG
jgi:small ligand-binding sensory domain FIST